jgi:hypothetical protein
MVTSRRTGPALVLSACIAVAAIGYLAGHRAKRAAPRERTLSASVANVLLQYPSSWQATTPVTQIPALPIGHPLLLARRGVASHAGLIAGQLPGGEPGPLPHAFVALLDRLPATELVNLLGNQAYRYPRLKVPGFAPEVTLYTIPYPSGETTVLACYASAGLTADARACEHIVGSLTLISQSQSYDLTPNATYAAELSALIATLESKRVPLRREMSSQAPSITLQQTANQLASVFSKAAKSVTSLEPALVAGHAQDALAAALGRARDAYTALATAVNEGGPTGVEAARKSIYEAEGAINSSLEDLELLGYRHT